MTPGGRINRAVELLATDQPIYYTGAHTGHVLTHEQGVEDAATWADYINVGMEHGSFDMTGLDQYMAGLVVGGPTRSGHRTPAVIVEAPVEGVSEEMVRYNAWQFRQILARGVHGILLCQAFHSDHLPVVSLYRQEEARLSNTPVHHHGAGAALTHDAAYMGSGQPKRLSEKGDQQLAWFYLLFVEAVIDPYLDPLLHSFSCSRR